MITEAWKMCEHCGNPTQIRITETIIELRPTGQGIDAESIIEAMSEQMAKKTANAQKAIYACTRCTYAERIEIKN